MESHKHLVGQNALKVIAQLQGKWKVQILAEMMDGPVRPGHLRRAIPGISRKILSENLKQLESAKLITRTDLSDRVLHVQYELAEDLRTVLKSLLTHLANFPSLFDVSQTEPANSPLKRNCKKVLDDQS